MSFTNKKLDFYNNKSYDEKTHANALGKGIPSFVVQGLELTGTTLTNGIFTNNGTFGQLGNDGETYTITSNYTGFVVIKSTLNGQSSVSDIILSATKNDSLPGDTSNIKYFTIYELSDGVIVNDFRHINYVKEYRFEQGESGVGWFRSVLNGFKSNEFNLPALVGNVLSVNFQEPDVNGNVTTPIGGATSKDIWGTGVTNATNLNDFIADSINNFIAKYGDEQNVLINMQVDNVNFPGLVELINETIGGTLNFVTPNITRYDIKIETNLNAGSGVTSENTTTRITFSDAFSQECYSCTFDLDSYDGLKLDTLINEKGDFGNVYMNYEEKIIAADVVNLFMINGQSYVSEITIPDRFRVTEVRYIWSQYDDTTNQALLTGTTNQAVGGGKIFNSANSLFYDIHTSGLYDPLMLTMSSNGADPTLPGNIKSCSLFSHKVNYSTKKLTVNGARYADVDNFYRKLVLNTIMIVGEYVNYQPSAVAIHLTLNPSLTLEDVIASGIFSTEEINQYNEIISLESEE